MPFKKGNNLGGRTAGSKNKASGKIREAIQFIIEDNIQQIERDLVELEPKDRIKYLIDLAKFVLPTLKAIDQNIVEAREGMQPIEISFID